MGKQPKAVEIKQRSRITEGHPFPLGATWDGLGVNFALFSAHATKVELCLFDNDGTTELERIELPEYTDEIWHGYLPDARAGTTEPPTGHSTTAAPFSRTARDSALAASERTVLISMNSLPLTSAFRRPSAPW